MENITPLSPDFVAIVRRDGVLLEHIGGDILGHFEWTLSGVGKRLDTIWPHALAVPIIQLTGRAIAQRNTVEAKIRYEGIVYEVRVTAQAPDRALCVVRPTVVADTARTDFASSRLDRRKFLRRFEDDLSSAALRESPTAVAIVYIDGITDVSRVIDSVRAEEIFAKALLRLRSVERDAPTEKSPWYLGALSSDTIAIVIATTDRDAIEACVDRVCMNLGKPIPLGDAIFYLTPYSGAAILGQDAGSPKTLLDHARTAADEARRSESKTLRFFADTMKLRSLARLDLARELSDAIANRDIGLKYVGRHDLATGRRVTNVGYLRWNHAFRGEIRPSEFVRVAEATGLARALSLSVLGGLRQDLTNMTIADAALRISFGALRHHVLHKDFVADISGLISDGAVSPEQLELRIAERTLIAADPTAFRILQAQGVNVVVDEVGRGVSSLRHLAQANLSGMQLDRSWAKAIGHDSVALSVSRAVLGMASAFGMIPIATAVDDAEQCQLLRELGCLQGTGDLYREPVTQERLARFGGSAGSDVGTSRAPTT